MTTDEITALAERIESGMIWPTDFKAASTALRDLQAQLAKAVEALRWIGDQAPATQEMTLAHQMADHARATLAEIEASHD